MCALLHDLYISHFADRQQNWGGAVCPNFGPVAQGTNMDILEAVELSDAPSAPIGYVPEAWALAVAAELERLKKSGIKAVLVHLEDSPRIRHVGPSRPLTQ